MSQLLSSVANRSRLMPWIWLPVLVLAGIGVQALATVTLWAVHLVIPLAAWLGARYGRRGFAVVVLGGLPLLVSWRYAALFGGSCLDIYLAALVVCTLATSSSWPRIQRFRLPSAAACTLAFVLLPLSIGFYGSDAGEFTYQLALEFSALLYLFVFLLGAAGFSTRVFAALLAGCTLFGMTLELLQLPENAEQLFGGPYAELPILGYTRLRPLWMEYGLDSPAYLFTTLGWFAAGRQVASLSEGHAVHIPWYRSWLPVALLALVGLGWETNTYVLTLITGSEPPPAFNMLGAFYALPCAALMAGLLLRWRGIWMVLALVLLFLLLDGLIRGRFDLLDIQPLFDLRDPAAVLGYGVLGIALRNRLLGTRDTLWSWQWTSYVVMTAVVLPVLFSLDSVLGLLWMLLAMIGSIVIGQWLARLRKRYLGWLPTHGGWLALLWLLAFLFVAVRSRDLLMQTAMMVREWAVANIESLQNRGGWYEPDGEEFIAMLLLSGVCVLFFSILQHLLQNASSCWGDLRELQSLVRNVVRGKQNSAGQGAEAVPATQVSTSAWPKLNRLAISSATALRNVAIGMLFAIPLIQTVVMFYPEEGMIAMVKDRFAPENSEPIVFDSTVAATAPAVNPYLWQAVREAYAQMPGTIDEPEGWLETDWYSIAAEPDTRQRIAIRVGEALESYALSINLRMQKRGLFGLWVEQDSYWDARKRDFVGFDPYVQQQEIAELLLARANELANLNTD